MRAMNNKYFFVTHNMKAGKEAEFKERLDKWNRTASADDKAKQTGMEDSLGFHSDLCIPINDSLIYCVWQVRNDLTGADLKAFLDSEESFYTPSLMMVNSVTPMDIKHPAFESSGMHEFIFGHGAIAPAAPTTGHKDEETQSQATRLAA